MGTDRASNEGKMFNIDGKYQQNLHSFPLLSSYEALRTDDDNKRDDHELIRLVVFRLLFSDGWSQKKDRSTDLVLPRKIGPFFWRLAGPPPPKVWGMDLKTKPSRDVPQRHGVEFGPLQCIITCIKPVAQMYQSSVSIDRLQTAIVNSRTHRDLYFRVLGYRCHRWLHIELNLVVPFL